MDRIVEIQEETANIMEGKFHNPRTILVKMIETCEDELETLIEDELLSSFQNSDKSIPDSDRLMSRIRKTLYKIFGHRSMEYKSIDFEIFFHEFYEKLHQHFLFRNIEIKINIDKNLPLLFFPADILESIMEGLIKNAVENTPDHEQILIQANKSEKNKLEFVVHDFGVGIDPQNHQRIFEGFFPIQDPLFYSTKTPFSFNAGGKGIELLRMKLFSKRFGFSLNMSSSPCIFLQNDNNEICPGDIFKCRFCYSQVDCLKSGFSKFSVNFST